MPRTYRTSVLLPLTLANGYKPRVMILGGGSPATATTEIMDLSVTPLQWQYGPSMSQPRIQMNATILPNGKVLALGGSRNNEDAVTASLNADLYDPNTNTFSPASANAFPRLYHSGSLLLPDATVLLVGGNPTRGSYESHMEIYSPAYLFNTDGSSALRPTITSVTPGAFSYGATFQVQTPDAANISSIVLVRPGAQTHAFDMDQRMVGLSYTTGSGVLNMTAPPNGNIAPPGYYMLFILNSAGVPSVARFVQLSTSSPNQAPTATITSPATDLTVNPGQAVAFAGTGSDPDGSINAYSWTFPGGNPGSSSLASPGNVTYWTPGTYLASFSVTDNGGLTSEPATRTITVPDFSLSAAPASQTVLPGGSTSFTATVTAGTGFTATVNFERQRAARRRERLVQSWIRHHLRLDDDEYFDGGYDAAGPVPADDQRNQRTGDPLRQRDAVNGDFSIAVTPTPPASRTINKAGSATYTLTIAAGQGFSGIVNLSVSGLPKFANPKFNPTSIVNSGTSVLTVNTNRNVAIGTYTLTITGTSGSRVHTATATLIIQ